LSEPDFYVATGKDSFPIQSRHRRNCRRSRGEASLERFARLLCRRRAFEATFAENDPLIYTVACIAPADGDGDLHYGLGLIMPGKIGGEYFMTKGHLHAWRPAAEFYIGLSGDGVMLLEDESESRMVELRPNGVIYVPGHTAHRTMNVGSAPLTYLGIYPAKAGHDYSTIVKNNFRCVVAERDGKPAMIERKKLCF
jgi:glucose-6-phosphate isomerase